MLTTMTRVRRNIIALVAVLLIAVGAPTAAWADSIDDLVEVDTALTAALDAFATVYSDQSAPIEDVVTAAQTFETAAQSAQADFQSVAAGADNGDIAGFADRFAGETGDMSAAAAGITAAFAAEDSAALTQAEGDLNTALDAYDATAQEYNAYLKTAGDPSYVGWLIVLIVAVVFLILTLLFAILTRKQTGLLPPKTDKKGNVQQASLKRLRWMVVLWAGVFVVGAAIPFFQVAFAEPDAGGNYTYRVFWYPLAAGAILSIIGVVQYFIAAAKVRREGSAEPHTAPAAEPVAPELVAPAPVAEPVAPAPAAESVMPAPDATADPGTSSDESTAHPTR